MSLQSYLQEWGVAFHSQAATDLNAVELLLRDLDNHPPPWSVVIMLMQMVIEKLTKAYFLSSGRALGGDSIHRFSDKALADLFQDHMVFFKFSAVLARERLNSSQPLAIDQDGVNWAEQITAAHPSNRKTSEWVEYPWETLEGIKLPEQDCPIVLTLAQNEGERTRILGFLRWFARNWQDPFVTV